MRASHPILRTLPGFTRSIRLEFVAWRSSKPDRGFCSGSLAVERPDGSCIDQQGNIRLIILGVTGAAFVTILLIVGNAMAGATRERTREIAVMKTLGLV